MDSKTRRIGFIGLGVLLAMLVAAVGSAGAADYGAGTGRDCQCGDTVVADWTFTEDLSCPPGHGLIIGADGITIDGAGFKITGSETADACDLIGEYNPGTGYCGIFNMQHDDVVIKNLEVENFCTGIGFQGTGRDPVVNNTIDNCEIHDNGNASCSSDTSTHGIHVCYVSGCTISNNKIYNNTGTGAGCGDGGNGIFLYAGKQGNNIITENELYENRKGGFFTKKGLHHSKITANHVYGNCQGGIILRCRMSNFNLIEKNIASGNFGDGIFIGGNNNTIRENVVKDNLAGFRIKSGDAIGDGDGIDMGRSDGSTNNTLISNEVCGNEGVDIEVNDDSIGNHGSENTCDTTENYDDAGTTGCTYACPEEINAEELAKELTEQGWTMYGAEWCGFCRKQKAEFGVTFEYVNYVDCGPRENPNPVCIKANITGIPCWISPDGTRYGYKNLTQLSELASEYRAAAQQPTATPISTPTPGFESILALTALIIVTYLFSKRELRPKRRK
ncbi:MAG: right-handed parallel beta-helix repeat-containing protein [Euryarchaeota archaeon]|nr:right-handed parallel beta-helix repeat-containing protein [Euryarchaeota archaeon]